MFVFKNYKPTTAEPIRPKYENKKIPKSQYFKCQKKYDMQIDHQEKEVLTPPLYS